MIFNEKYAQRTSQYCVSGSTRPVHASFTWSWLSQRHCVHCGSVFIYIYIEYPSLANRNHRIRPFFAYSIKRNGACALTANEDDENCEKKREEKKKTQKILFTSVRLSDITMASSIISQRLELDERI